MEEKYSAYRPAAAKGESVEINLLELARLLLSNGIC